MAVAYPPQLPGNLQQQYGNYPPRRGKLPGPLDPNDAQSQAFWSEFMRRPDAKAAYQAETRLQEKKQKWLEDRRAIEICSERRKLVADALEECPAEIRKFVAPMFHIKIVEKYLWEVYEECQRRNQNPDLVLGKVRFADRLQEEKHMKELRHFREQFQEGGVRRMEELEKQNEALSAIMRENLEKKTEKQPERIDMQTLKSLLEYAQECKFEGNSLFKEGLYEEALTLYSQADEAMKKYKIDKHLKNEHKWFVDSHLACLKNKAQAALRLEMFQTALDASEDALKLDDEDHKAWFRKVQALKGLGKFGEAEESLVRLEDVGQWCPDRRRILQECETERKRLQVAIAKHKQGTKNMLGKAFEAGIFSIDREKELEEAAKSLESKVEDQDNDRRRRVMYQNPVKAVTPSVAKPEVVKPIETARPVENKIHLTAALAGDLMDELAESYSQKGFQERVRKCARDSGYERSVFLLRLKNIAFEVQRPILENWGFEGDEQGLREMTSAIRDHAAGGKEMPAWLKEKHDKCLELLYGGKQSGMLELLTS